MIPANRVDRLSQKPRDELRNFPRLNNNNNRHPLLHPNSCKITNMGSTDLESQALQQFDRLLANGELLWNENQPRHIDSEPFDVSGLSISSLGQHSFPSLLSGHSMILIYFLVPNSSNSASQQVFKRNPSTRNKRLPPKMPFLPAKAIGL